ncbi:hypothetical protein EI94DRAFT_1699674 [Lactarius quietus]|nr:hypothetical protein EI94DRAFT_1699674 [Lactarius quietus]
MFLPPFYIFVPLTFASGPICLIRLGLLQENSLELAFSWFKKSKLLCHLYPLPPPSAQARTMWALSPRATTLADRHHELHSIIKIAHGSQTGSGRDSGQKNQHVSAPKSADQTLKTCFHTKIVEIWNLNDTSSVVSWTKRIDFADQTLLSCLNTIHDDLVEIWNLNDQAKYLLSDGFKARMSHVAKDLARSAGKVSNPYPTGGGTEFADWVHGVYMDSQENVCGVMGYIVDLTVILNAIFNTPSGGIPSEDVLDSRLSIAILDLATRARFTATSVDLSQKNFVYIVAQRLTTLGEDLPDMAERHSMDPLVGQSRFVMVPFWKLWDSAQASGTSIVLLN